MIKDYVLFAVNTIKQRRTRSWLTALGVIIGIALVIALISLGEGLRAGVTQQLRSFGADLVYVIPGEEGGPLIAGFVGGVQLANDDVDTIEKVRGVRKAIPMVFGSITAEYGGEKKTVMMHGIPAESKELFEESQGWALHDGRWFKEGENAIVLGYWLAKVGFDKEVRTRKSININGEDFKVVGVFEEIGERMHDYQAAYMPLDAFRELTGKEDGIDTIIVQVSAGADMDKVEEDIKTKLERQRGVEDFTVITPAKAEQIVGNVIGTIELVVIGIAAVALLVGGIGIMNTMYTSVLERTKEIGVMKAVGARDFDVLLIFLTESGVLGLVGGGIGLAIGIGLAKAAELFAHQAGFKLLQVSVTIELVAFGLGFSFLIGVIAGLLPARRAARLRPADALRYE